MAAAVRVPLRYLFFPYYCTLILRRMKKAGLLFFLFSVCFWVSYSQAPLVKKWDYRYGGSADDGLNAWLPPPSLKFLQETADSGFIIGGASLSGISGDRTQANWG